MEILAMLLLMAIVGEFGGFLKGMGWVIVLVIGIGLAITGISEMYWEDMLILLLAIGIPTLGIGVYLSRNYMRKKWEIAKYGFDLTEEERMNAYYKEENYNIKAIKSGKIKILTDEDRKRIAEIGVYKWKTEQIAKRDEMGVEAWGKEQIRLYQMPKPKRKRAANLTNDSDIFWFDKMRPIAQIWLTVKDAIVPDRYRAEHRWKDITASNRHGGKI